jgi:hypothetical protein
MFEVNQVAEDLASRFFFFFFVFFLENEILRGCKALGKEP